MLSDQNIRDIVVTNPKQSFRLSAGAGAGKTSILVDRITRLVLDGCDPANIVAITFTEKAAGELRRRISEKLRQYPSTTEQPIERAQIGTIHSYAKRLTQSFPTAGDPIPATNIIEAERVREHIRIVEREWLRDRNIAKLFSDAISNEVIERRKISELSTAILERSTLLFSETVDAAEIARSMDCTREAWQELRSIVSSSIKSHNDELYVLLQDFFHREFPDSAETGKSIEAWIGSGLMDQDGAPTLIGRLGKAANWAGYKQVHAARVALLKAAIEWRDLLAVRESMAWRPHFTRLHEIFVQRLRSNGEARFDDLIESAIRCAQCDQFRQLKTQLQLHLDESQDTDPRQIELWKALATPGSSVFVVGDSKQAIYGFRGATADAFDGALREHIESIPNGESVALSANFRSTPVLIDFFNRFFAPRFAGSYQPMSAGKPHDNPVCMPAIVHITSTEKYSSDESETAFAMRLAAFLAEARDRGELPKRNSEIAWHEIAVLMQRSTKSAYYEIAFRAYGIPFVNESAYGLLDRDVILDVVNALAVIADPGDGIGLLGGLRGALFGVPDEQLWEWRNRVMLATGLAPEGASPREVVLELTSPLVDLPEPLQGALSTLWRLSQKRWHVSPAEIVGELYDATGILNATYCDNEDADRTALNGFLRIARRYSDASLLQFVELMRSARESGERIESVLPDAPAVRMMTIHGAKGLEFDWVAIAGMSGFHRLNPNTSVIEIHPDLGTVEFCFSRFAKTKRFDEAKALKRERELQERNRLLYVAMTRARKRLFVSTIESKSSNKLDAQMRSDLQQAFGEETATISIETIPLSDPIERVAPFQTTHPILMETFPSGSALRSVTSAAHAELPPSVFESISDSDGVEFGSYVHRVMSRLHADSSDEEIRVATRWGLQWMKPDSITSGVEWSTRAERFAVDFLKVCNARNWNSGKWFHEEAIAWRDEIGDVITGTVDLRILMKDCVVIIDYKTGKQIAESLLAAYQKQVTMYCSAWRNILPEVRIEGYLYLCESGELIEVATRN